MKLHYTKRTLLAVFIAAAIGSLIGGAIYEFVRVRMDPDPRERAGDVVWH
jgi:hypothetical protein